MVKLISLLSIFLFTGSLPISEPEGDCTLSIEFSNFRNKEGVLYIFLYNYENQYPDNPFMHFAVDKKNVKNDHLLVNLPKLSKGIYAVSILDDENDNEDLDMWLGIPTEGYAFSNNVRPLFALPDYKELIFNLDKPSQRIKLKMRYVL